jgi:hypothetical protein
MIQKIPTEFDEQCFVFKWCSFCESRYPCLKYIFSTLNGVRLTIRQAVNAKRSGNKKGVPDIILPYNNGTYSGLFVELKRVKLGSVSLEQKEFIKYLESQNYKALVCKGSESAINAIKEYIGFE